ncbi:uncharacterized protein LOC123563620 [Mercenaria mercenaria]|uniref:uncharacterized protein LOC123563620 n=1 Tax=Mercenaria mercenaria TaxID=6596 RepID=UPI00234F97F4|nr:uncharacterized protein LOC123563620 [Mercenaria mercenaria]
MSCMIPSLWLSYEMETSHILFITLCLMILPHWNKLQSTDHDQGQVSYPMCVESELGMALVDRGKEPFHGSFKNNTSTSCTSHCLKLEYKFAGTKEKLCYCADSIRNDTDAATCDKECPGDKNEVCGGEEGISCRYHLISISCLFNMIIVRKMYLKE